MGYKFIHPFSEKINYITDKRIIIDGNIIEYDISKANINVLKAYGLLSEQDYVSLMNSDKMTREIYIGNRIAYESNKNKKSESNECIKEGIRIAKDKLLTLNNIDPENIIRIANDAVYIDSIVPLKHTSFDILNNGNFITFNMKNVFSSFIKLKNKILIFCRFDNDENIVVDVKGIDDELLPLHQKFLGFICEILFYLKRTDKNTTLKIFNEFYFNYINLKLEIDYYREFNSDSGIRIRALNKNYATLYLSEEYKNRIDINYNLYILRELYNIILMSK